MIDIKNWMNTFLDALNTTFSDRVCKQSFGWLL